MARQGTDTRRGYITTQHIHTQGLAKRAYLIEVEVSFRQGIVEEEELVRLGQQDSVRLIVFQTQGARVRVDCGGFGE